jgi:hypothetical protein
MIMDDYDQVRYEETLKLFRPDYLLGPSARLVENI